MPDRYRSFAPSLFLGLTLVLMASAPPALAQGEITGPIPQVRSCPYDILALCCTESKGGKCIHWENCCQVILDSSDADGTADPTAGPSWQVDLPIRDKPSRCERDCKKLFSDPAGVDLCIEQCSFFDLLDPDVTAMEGPNGEKLGIPLPPVHLHQLGGFRANVPMHYISWISDFPEETEMRRHHLSPTTQGNLNAAFRLRVECKEGQKPDWIGVRNPKQETEVLLDQVHSDSVWDEVFQFQPFSRDAFNLLCREALGGTWIAAQGHPQVDPVEQVWLQSTVEVGWHCTGEPVALKEFTAMTHVSCIDLFTEYVLPRPVPPGDPG